MEIEIKDSTDIISQNPNHTIESSNGELTFKLVALNMVSPSNCKFHCPEKSECTIFLDRLRNGSLSTTFTITTVTLIITNETLEPIKIDYSKIQAIDVNGFVYSSVELCTGYSFDKISGNYMLPPLSKATFEILFSNVKDAIEQIFYSYQYEKKRICLSFNSSNNVSRKTATHEIILNLENQINSLTRELDKLKEELYKENNRYEELKQKYYKDTKELKQSQNSRYPEGSFMQRMDENALVKYKIIEDDDYWRLYSLEKNDTISFNREFNTAKDNYNWVNIGDPIVTLKVDNVVFGMNAPTIIKSTVSGLFEYSSNKMISYDEEICRIRKYSQDEKDSILEALERNEIKQTVLKKERKKMIERETLDELIDEGKVFNVYTKKEGNRGTIPMDIATAVWNRDGGRCSMCGSRENLEFDHIIPVSKGGATTFRNLQLLCKRCNLIKSDNI